MITVVAYRDDRWGAPKLDKCQWAEVCGSYGAELQMIDNADDLDLSGPVVAFDEHGDVPLNEFEHLETGTYVFGRSSHDVLLNTPHDVSVRIGTANPVRTLFGVSAAAIVLHDRHQRL